MKKTLLTIFIATMTTTLMTSVYADAVHEGGNAGAAGGHWASPKEDAEKPNPIKATAVSVERGKKLYFQNCSSCHGATAMGDGPVGASLNPKPTNLFAMSGGHPDGDFAWKIANGRGAMPAWKSTLSENQIWDLVNYIQQLNPNGKKMDMSNMDHSNMSKEDMQKMMGKAVSKEGHSKSGHDTKPKAGSHDDKPHGH